MRRARSAATVPACHHAARASFVVADRREERDNAIGPEAFTFRAGNGGIGLAHAAQRIKGDFTFRADILVKRHRVSTCEKFSVGILSLCPRFVKWLLLLAVLLNVAAAPPVLTSGTTPSWRLYPSQVATVSRLGQRPNPTAKAALLVDVDTKTILYERQMTLRLPQASTTKIMTAVVALEQGRLDDRVTVPANLQADGSLMGLQPGETLTLKELLYGLLLPSGNDAALVIAQHISGSVESFVAAMNAKAQALGLTDTHFENPHGHDSPNHYSSARDLWRLAVYALENPVFAEIVSTPAAKIAGRDLVNRNEMLLGYPDADGVKTGTTDLAGECLVVTVRRNGHRALAVVLGSEDRYADARALLDYYYDNFGWRTLQLPANALGRVRDGKGQSYTLQLTSPGDAFLPRWQWPFLQSIVTLGASKQGVPNGTVRFRVGPFVLDDLPVVGKAP